MAETWLLCSACRTDIPFSSKYFQCSVSTCNRARMRLVFCSVVCWDSHVATLRHREAWAEDKIAPSKAEWEREQGSSTPEPVRPGSGSGPVRPVNHSASGPITRPASPSPGSGPITRPASPSPGSPGSPGSPSGVGGIPGERRVVSVPTASSSFSATPAPAATGVNVELHEVTDRDILVVVSKLKKYIKDRSGMNCSDAVVDVLSEHLRVLCDDSIRAAGRDDRKTVLDRDVPRPRRS